MECILGYIGAPIAWLVGVASEDIVVVGQLAGREDRHQRILCV